MANPHPINPHPWLESEFQIIRDNYPTLGKKATAALLGRTPGATQLKASQLGVRSLVTKKLMSATKLAVNTSSDVNYFKTWTPNMAWMLGYVWADGAITCDSLGPRRLSFGCQEQDGEIIYKIRDELKATQKIRHQQAKRIPGTDKTQGQPSVCLSVNSKILVRDLIDLHGIRPNKSNLDNPFPTIPDELFAHFARGNLDGDGSVSFCKEQGMSSGSVEFIADGVWLKGFQDQLCRLTGLPAGPMKSLTGKALHRIRWHGKDNLAILFPFLYPPGDYLFLARKRLKLTEIFEYQRDHVISQSTRNWKPEEDTIIRERFPDEGAMTLASVLGRSANAVQERAWFLRVWRTKDAIQRERIASNPPE